MRRARNWSGAIRELNEDERAELIALAWLGRGTYDLDEWDEAVSTARIRTWQARRRISASACRCWAIIWKTAWRCSTKALSMRTTRPKASMPRMSRWATCRTPSRDQQLSLNLDLAGQIERARPCQDGAGAIIRAQKIAAARTDLPRLQGLSCPAAWPRTASGRNAPSRSPDLPARRMGREKARDEIIGLAVALRRRQQRPGLDPQQHRFQLAARLRDL